MSVIDSYIKTGPFPNPLSIRFPWSILPLFLSQEGVGDLLGASLLDLGAMARNTACTVYIGNLDEKVSERVLYEILVQVGRVVDLHIPRDKETNRHKGYAFAEYETEEIADYAVRLFSGLVRLHNRVLKFAISGQDKPTQNASTPVTPKLNSPPLPKTHFVNQRGTDVSRESAQLITNCRVSIHNASPIYSQASSDGLVSRGFSNDNYEYSRRIFGSMLNGVSRQAARQPITYPSY